ncbi:MAG: ATP-grasp domain-containing protein, partial [Planctomycetota bacterium]|nr:ATP-grasp domain-containing protein [Planctomycetota bacterium]
IDDAARAPILLLSLTGGSGVEDRAAHVHRIPVDIRRGVDADKIRALFQDSDVDPKSHNQLTAAIESIVRTAKEVEARSLEVNPLVTTTDGRVLAADCRITIDDYAVFRHPELGIDIARELDHPPTELERIAYRIEQADHRGTFYFARLPVSDDDRPNMIGFHGAGGGGSMMSMDAVNSAGFTPANFTDTSGNPSSAKVYAAARIILRQEDIVGYFGSGSGVASQEQFWSAYGLAKAFIELNLDIPAVIRLGGNSEDRAVEILMDACKHLPAAVEGFRKDDSPKLCADRFHKLVNENNRAAWQPRARTVPDFVGAETSDSFRIQFAGADGGRVWIDHSKCTPEVSALVVKHSGGVLKLEDNLPLLAISEEDAATKDSEMIACEIECRRAGHPVVFVDLPIPGIDVPAPRGIAAATESGLGGTP